MSQNQPINLAFKIYEPAEKGTSSDVIMLHGITGNKEMFDNVGQNIADKSNRRVYSLDMRNHGDSSWSDEFGWQIMADDVLHFMYEHSISSATLAGHSMGGIISMMLALAKPEKVDAIVIEDISPVLPKEDIRKGIAGMIQLVQSSLQSLPPDTDISGAIKHVGGELAKNMPEELKIPEEHAEKFFAGFQTLLVQKEGRVEAKMNCDVIKNFITESKEHVDLEGLYQKPSIFVCGSKSQFKVMDDKDRILELFPNAQFKPLEGATHLAHIEYPEEFSEIVIRFLNNEIF